MFSTLNNQVSQASFSLPCLGLKFMYTLTVCLILELLGGILALLFRNQVSKIQHCYISEKIT